MRLNVTQHTVAIHTEYVTSLGWNNNDLYSVADDRVLQKWDKHGEPISKVCTFSDNTFPTDLHWFPSGRKQQSSNDKNDLFVLGCTDGSFKIISKSGRVEKTVENAHVGALTALRWSYDGTSLLTAGEDGFLKIWSRNGMLRSTLLQLGRAIYSVSWSPNDENILLTSGKDLIIKPIQPSSKHSQWTAHDAPILKVDWNPVNNLIVSGGEDCKYKVWDSYGRLLFQSKALDSIVTSVSWSPDGEFFAVGCFNNIRLCDKTGWSYCRERTNSGSISNISWTPDGTQLAGGGGNGAVIFGYLVDRRLHWKNFEAILDSGNHLKVLNVNTNELVEEMNFRDRVIKMALGFDHLIVATQSQCHIYNVINWGPPVVFDLKDTVNLITQSEKCFLTVDNFSGIQVYNYDGRILCNPKFKGLRADFLNSTTISLSNDYVAIVDRSDSKSIHVVELSSGKPLPEGSLTHTMEVAEIFLNSYGPPNERKIVLIDRNMDLYITPILKKNFVKLASMASSAMWSDRTDILVAIADGKFVVWLYPAIVYVDKDLTPRTRISRDASDFGKNSSKLLTFQGTSCTGRRADGALVTTSIAAYPLILYQHIEKLQWDSALRLCRHVKDGVLWSTLAGMAINLRELKCAEEAYAAIEEVDRLQYVSYVLHELPSTEARNASLLLFKRQPQDAETVLLQAGLIYRAIKLNVRLFRWERALDLAIKHKTHIDTVLALRQRYLKEWGREENHPKFVKYSEGVTIDWEKIKAKIQQEKEKEREKSAGGRR